MTVAYKPEEGTTRGDIRHMFRVHTDLAGEPPLDLTATLHVDPVTRFVDWGQAGRSS